MGMLIKMPLKILPNRLFSQKRPREITATVAATAGKVGDALRLAQVLTSASLPVLIGNS
jgi:hypothetical protein